PSTRGPSLPTNALSRIRPERNPVGDSEAEDSRCEGLIDSQLPVFTLVIDFCRPGMGKVVLQPAAIGVDYGIIRFIKFVTYVEMGMGKGDDSRTDKEIRIGTKSAL